MAYKTALITGASSGIGQTFAEQLAAEGTDLVLVARSRDKLEQLGARLRQQHGVRVEVIDADLSQPQPGERLREALAQRGLAIDLLVNNAGFGAAGNFHKLDAARTQQMIALNVAAVVDIAQALLPAMVEAGRGAVINVASAGAFQPMPFMAVYGASKAFVLSFTEALWAEYRRKNIHFVALCPGPVDTAFFEATGSPDLRKSVPRGFMMRADAVVRQSLRALKTGQVVVVPGASTQLLSLFPRIAPRKWVAATAAMVMGR